MTVKILSKRDKIIIGFSSLGILFALGVFISYFMLSKKMGEMGSPINIKPIQQDFSKLLNADPQVKLSQVKMLRDKLKPWSLRNKEAILRLRHSQDRDLTAWNQLANSIPGMPDKDTIGMDFKEYCDTLKIPGTNIVEWTWRFRGQVNPPDYKEPEQTPKYVNTMSMEKETNDYHTRLQQDKKNIIISLNNSSSYSLWADGSVTTTNKNASNQIQIGKHRFAEKTFSTVLPPYKELGGN